MTFSGSSGNGDPPEDAVQRLLTAARQGDGDAFGRLFEEFRRSLLLLAQRELPPGVRGKMGPSDIVQETAVDARCDFHGFRGRTTEECYAWLRSILRNNVVDAVRRYETSLKRQADREISLTSESGDRAGGLLPVRHSPPDNSAIRREEAVMLGHALERLPVDYREVLRLRYWDGLSFVEIATRLGRSAEAIRKVWYRAIRRLQEELASESTGAHDAPRPSPSGNLEQAGV